jgi:hypothetical protein
MNVFDRRSGLEILQVNQWIFAQQNIRGQDPVRIKEVFCPPHQIRECVAPFAPDKRSHVGPCSMLRLQRAVILIQHHFDQVTHEAVVALAARVLAHLFNHHEMQISVGGMPRGPRLISVFGQKIEQIMSSLRKLCGWETNILDNEATRARKAEPSSGSGRLDGPAGPA